MGHTAPLTAWPIQPPVLWTLRAGSGKRRGQGEAVAAPGGQQSGAWRGPAGVNPGVRPGPCLEAPSLGRLWEASLLEGLLVPCRTSAGHPRVSAEREGQGPRPQLEGLSTLPPQSRQRRVAARGCCSLGPWVPAGPGREGGACLPPWAPTRCLRSAPALAAPQTPPAQWSRLRGGGRAGSRLPACCRRRSGSPLGRLARL